MWRVRGEERGGRRGLHGGFHPGSGESVGDPSWNCIDGKKEGEDGTWHCLGYGVLTNACVRCVQGGGGGQRHDGPDR